MTFDAFVAACTAAGLTARDCGNGHWRVEGGLVAVNYYPASRRRTVWMNGTTGNTSFPGNDQLAIDAALGKAHTMQPGASRTARKPAKMSKVKRRWWAQGRRRCAWCMCQLTRDTMTVDHVVPLYRGGSNLADNLVPACEPCNKKRGHQLGSPLLK